jgi:hypothetical protein
MKTGITFHFKKIVGIIVTLTDSQAQNFILISNLWKKFNREIHRIENRSVTRENWEKYGIMYRKKRRSILFSWNRTKERNGCT